jgi:hypothetical protein
MSLPRLNPEQWAELYAQADNSATNYWGTRYYADDEGSVAIVRWHPHSAKTLGHEYTLWGVRRNEPYGFASQESVEQWFARLKASCRDNRGSYTHAWLLPMTQLAELAGAEPKVRVAA